MVRVKICGITNPGDAKLAAELGAHAIGLNFYPQSPRGISPHAAANIIKNLPPFVAPAGVFVNWAADPVIALCKALHLSSAQLHGDETPQTCAAIAQQIPVIKVFRLGKGSALPKFAKYPAASAFLLDAASASEFGGTGKIIDWPLARRAASSHRIILAGGLTPENIAEAIRVVQPYAVDVASGVESRPGRKNPAKLREFFAEVARANHLLAVDALDGVFVGTWQLDPTTLDYEYGAPGLRATYVVEKTPNGLRFHLDADDADGKQINVSYGGELDGREKPVPGMDAALVLSRLEGNIIESALKRGGKIVDRWTREVLPDQKTMRIIQHVTDPGGREFRNVGLYRRTK